MKWEYMTAKLEPRGIIRRAVVQADLDELLARVGRDGWELVTSCGIHEAAGRTREVVLVFKRSF